MSADYDIVRKMRASFLILGPLVARAGRAKVSLPGGCAIGARPVDLHLKAMERLGATVELEDGYVVATAPNGLKGAELEFPFVSVGATENTLMAASLAKGETVLLNAAREPEIDDLGHCLIAMGAKIAGLGTSRIVVEGVKTLHAAEHSVLPDRIETGTYAMAAAIAGGEVELTVHTRPALIGAVLFRCSNPSAPRSPRPIAGSRFIAMAYGRSPSTSRPRRSPASRPICRRSSWRLMTTTAEAA